MNERGQYEPALEPNDLGRFFVASGPTLEPGEPHNALVNGDLALTSTRLVGGGATAEVARRQPDGTWLWMIDRPNVLG